MPKQEAKKKRGRPRGIAPIIALRRGQLEFGKLIGHEQEVAAALRADAAQVAKIQSIIVLLQTVLDAIKEMPSPPVLPPPNPGSCRFDTF